MDRREFLGTAAAGALAAAAPLPGEKGAERRPNLIFILADDLGYGDIGCFGQQRIRTPALDRMAAQGMRLTQHYAGSTVCAPSRACLMLGRHTAHLRTPGQGQSLIPTDRTVAGLLRGAGYATACIGKWGLGQEGSEGVPAAQGFDAFFGYLNQTHAHNYYPEFLWHDGEKVVLRNEVVRPERLRQAGFGGAATKRVDYSHDRFTEEALAFVRQQRQGPFFLYLAYTLPHANNEAGILNRHGMEVPDYGAYDSADWPEPQKGHAAMITRLDRDVGRVLDLLRELGIDEQTLVLFSSDNGPHAEGGAQPDFFDSNGPLRGIKRDLYEGGIRVPTLARWPGRIPAGSVSHHVSAFWDFLPTACDVAGIAAPEGIDGISYLPALTGVGSQKTHECLYWEFLEKGGKQAVRFGDWKALRLNVLKDPDGPLELYNLADDPGETRNLAEEHPEVTRRARELLARTAAQHPEPRPFTKGPVLSGGPLPPAPAVHLSDLDPLLAEGGTPTLGPPKRDRSIRGEPLKIGGKIYARGYGVHAPSELVFALKPDFERFVACVGPDDERPGSMVFQVLLDGREVASSPLLTPRRHHGFDIPIPPGSREIRLRVTDGGNGSGSDHGDWVDAGFLLRR
ncbi:MAG: sulfatase-like hydrolase/transferase [Lentisphaeria bacterium]|nr:sulfatase-like hydrolase/transferase [Lentisphaeria bacterium]